MLKGEEFDWSHRGRQRRRGRSEAGASCGIHGCVVLWFYPIRAKQSSVFISCVAFSYSLGRGKTASSLLLENPLPVIIKPFSHYIGWTSSSENFTKSELQENTDRVHHRFLYPQHVAQGLYEIIP